MFNKALNLVAIKAFSTNTIVDQLGIEITEIGSDFLKGIMPVDHRTIQPMGLLHGGASVVLAETLGSLAATMAIDSSLQHAVGLDINANHIKSATAGTVEGIARPIHIGRTTHVWEIKIHNEQAQLICISRLTMAIIDKK